MTSGAPDFSLAALGILGFRVIPGRREYARAGVATEPEDFNPVVVLRWPGRAGEISSDSVLRLNEFLGENRETLTLSEIQAICDHLLAGKVYQGGGGSGERWTLEVLT